MFFDFGYLQKEKRVQSWTKSANFGYAIFSINTRILQKYSKQGFFFARVLLLVRISAILDHIGGVIAQIPPKKDYFVDAESVRKT